MPENFLEINRYFALTSYCNTIGQSNNAFSILGFSLAGKRRVHVLIFSLIKQITNTCTETIFQGHTKNAVYIQLKNRHCTQCTDPVSLRTSKRPIYLSGVKFVVIMTLRIPCSSWKLFFSVVGFRTERFLNNKRED